MRFIPLIILVYVLLGVEVGAGPFLAYRGSVPDLGLIAVVYIGLNARRQFALGAALVIGLVQDSLSVHPLGLYAVGFAVAAYLVLGMRDVVHRGHPLTHLTFTLFAGVVVAGVELAQGLVHPPPPGAGRLLDQIGYTAVAALVLLYPLQRMRRIFFIPA